MENYIKRLCLAVLVALVFINSTFAQELYYTKSGHVNFFSSTPLEDISADNNKVTSIVDLSTGEIEFSVLIMAFEFEKALMQEHFNENYMESAKYPKAIFKGKIENMDKIDFTKDGTYEAKVKGDITIHGVTKPMEANGNFNVKGNQISANSEFKLAPADFNIEIPSVVRDNIAKEIKVTVANTYVPFSK